MQTQSDLYFLKLLQDSLNSLDELDNLIESNGSRQSEVDSELSDLLHLIENNELSETASVKIVRRIHDLRKVRRSLRNEYELILKYNEVKGRLTSKENRKFIVAEIRKRMKSLNNEYQNRVLAKEQVDELLKNDHVNDKQPRSRRTRSEESKEIDKQIKQLLEQGKSQTEIAKILYMTQPNVSMRVKRIREASND